MMGGQLVYLLLLFTSSVDAITRQECTENYLPERIACYDSTSPSDCEPLPMPEEAFPTQELNQRGYALINLRNSPTTQIYAVTDNTAISLIVVDLPVATASEERGVNSEAAALAEKVKRDQVGNEKDDKARDGTDENSNQDGKQNRNKGAGRDARRLGAIKGVFSKPQDHRTLKSQSGNLRRAKKPNRSISRQPQDDVDLDSFDEEIALMNVALPMESMPFNAEDSAEEEATALSPTRAPTSNAGLNTNSPTFYMESEAIFTTGHPTQSPVETVPPNQSAIEDELPPSQVDAAGVYVAMIDHPEAFLRRDPATGEINGNLNLLALEEILLLHSLEKEAIVEARLIYTHSHTDHAGGANTTYPVLKDVWKVPIVTIEAQDYVQKTYETLIDLDLWTNRAPLPDVSYPSDNPSFLRIGDSVVLEIHATNGPTNQGSQGSIIYIEAEDDQPPILMCVDAIYPQWSPSFRFSGTENLLDYIMLHDQLLQFSLDGGGVFIGGHVNQLGTLQDILVNQDLVNAVLDASAEALMNTSIDPIARELGFFDPTTVYYSNRWALFREYLKIVNNNCAKVVVEEFGCRLAGVDAVADTLCNVGQSFWGITA